MDSYDDLPDNIRDETGKQQVEIRIKGQIDENWSEWFQDFDIQIGEDRESILLGEVKDQADLYGLIAKMRDLGITLIAVNILD
jgi:hypothetical protein